MKYFTLSLLLFASIFAQAQPTDNAPEPPMRDPGDVISIYGDAYTNITDVNYNPFWGQSGNVDIAYDPGSGDLVMAYTNFNFQGTDFAANPQNASAMEFIHIDVWTSTATDLKFSPIDNSGMGAGEFLVNVPLVNGGWSSVDLPIGDFTGMTWNSVFQLKFDAQQGMTPADIYLDNIYFWKTGADPATDATLSSLQVDGANLPGFAPSANTYSYGVPGGGAVPQITSAVTNNPMATVTAINQAPGIPGDATVEVTAADGMTTNTYTISYFFNSPATGAPIPTHTNVISLFSDEYTDVNVDFWLTGWSQAAFEEDTIAGNPTKKYTNVGFIGVETTTEPLDVTGMTYMHMDIWTPNMNKFNVKLVSFLGDGPGGANGDSEANLDYFPTKGEWNQLHIPLDSFIAKGLTGLDDMNQYIFTSDPFGAGIVFIDNVYFTTEEATDIDDVKQLMQKVVVYPNPATTEANIYATTDIRRTELFDLSGRLILVSQNPTTINLSGVDSGLYLVRMTDKDGAIHTQKLLVN